MTLLDFLILWVVASCVSAPIIGKWLAWCGRFDERF